MSHRAKTIENNPFTPGIGEPPPVMGRRPSVEHVLNAMLDLLKRGTPRARYAYLYGPRGNGKTVLLRWLKEKASAVCILTVTLEPVDMVSNDKLVGAVMTHVRHHKINLELKRVAVEAQISRRDRAYHALRDVLMGVNQPLLIALDEAHKKAVDPLVLGTLMDAVQGSGEKIPIALSLAGTPATVCTHLFLLA